MFRFLHTGDLHLDSPFAGLSEVAPEAVAKALREATVEAWRSIVSLGLTSKVDFVLIAGDTFENANRTLLGQLRFRDGLADLAKAGVPSFIVTGNHDHDSGWAPSISWPEISHRFPSNSVRSFAVKRDGEELARVYGIGYKTRDVRANLATKFVRESGVPFAVGLLHANVGADPTTENYAPCSLDDLRAADMDYWALGHVHRPQVLCKPRPTVVYSGAPQGLNPNETEAHGCYLVTVDGSGDIHADFHAVDAVRWHILEVPINGLKEEEALIDQVAQAVDAARSRAERSIVARVRLTGRGPLHLTLAKQSFLADLATAVHEMLGESTPFAWLESIRDETRPELNLDERRLADDFLGDVLKRFERTRVALECSAAEAEVNEEAGGSKDIQAALDRLYSNERARPFLRQSRPDRDALRRLISQAETRVADQLSGGE